MSRWIRLSDSRGRDARVRMRSRCAQPTVKYQNQDGYRAKPHQVIKAPLQKSYTCLLGKISDNKEIARLLIESDPEIDLEAAGRKTGPTDRVLLDQEGAVLYSASMTEIVYDANGHVIEQREPTQTNANISTETPLRWTGKYFKRQEAACRFVFSRNYQLVHVDGLTFDFLYAMADELHKRNSLVLVGAGPRGKDPILVERNGNPYRGFLEGRTQNGKYLLVLHLSSLELSQTHGSDA